jgi:hypothetical protein
MKKPTDDQAGLKKLPTAVRNKMGYMKNGGKVKAKGMAMGGKVKSKGYAMGGRVKSKGMAMGGKVKSKGMAMGGKVQGFRNGGAVMVKTNQKPHMS